jgi:hypothetical protein
MHSLRRKLKVPAWDCRSAARLWSRTAAVCGQRLIRVKGQHFILCCQPKPKRWKCREPEREFGRTWQTVAFEMVCQLPYFGEIFFRTNSELHKTTAPDHVGKSKFVVI